MITYNVTIKTLDLSLSFSIVSDPKVDGLSPIDCRGDLAFFEINDKIVPAIARRNWYTMAGFVSHEMYNAQCYCEGDAEAANDVISLIVEETLQDGQHVM